MRITSSRNPVVKHVRSLERAAKRREYGVYTAEGVRLLNEALAAQQPASIALYDPEALQRSAEGTSLLEALPDWADELHEVDARVLSAVSHTESPQGILAVLRFPTAPPLAEQQSADFGVVLDTVRDPGNAGTIARTALAAGARYLVTTPGSVDLFAPKVVRAGMGAHFRLPMYAGVPWSEIADSLHEVTMVAGSSTGEESVYRFNWPERSALVVGSEAQGLSPEARSAVSRRIRIPMRAGVESLNASVAAGILIYAARAPKLDAGVDDPLEL